eukprot:TRINITY_DN22497_c0_g1_i1.p2 TRINITY_DN22497_c0_g1~~TRINITY_DN22497_c0_g1_i1.p2  ORF type:complete len:122 (-),score=4.19 TRINITY_DN22497_c0_g1_i1:377-742(-)
MQRCLTIGTKHVDRRASLYQSFDNANLSFFNCKKEGSFLAVTMHEVDVGTSSHELFYLFTVANFCSAHQGCFSVFVNIINSRLDMAITCTKFFDECPTFSCWSRTTIFVAETKTHYIYTIG